MDRNEISHWLDEHRDLVEGDPAALLQRCEVEVRRHTSEDAWLAAKDYVERRMRAWQLEWGPRHYSSIL